MLSIRNDIYNYAVSHGFANIYAKQGSLQITWYFQCQTKSIIVLFNCFPLSKLASAIVSLDNKLELNYIIHIDLILDIYSSVF